MKKIMNIKIVILIILVSLMACACKDKDYTDNKKKENSDIDTSILDEMKFDDKILFEYDFSTYIKACDTKYITNSIAYDWKKSIEFNQLKMSKMNIYFDNQISIDDTKIFIEEILSELTYISNNYCQDEKLNIYITDKIKSCLIEDIIFIEYADDIDTIDIIAQILLGIYGENSNYGLIYGEAVCVENKIRESSISRNLVLSEDCKAELADDEMYFNLSYPLFIREFSKSYKIDIAKEFAVKFVNYINVEYGEEIFLELLEKSSEYALTYENDYKNYMYEFLNFQNMNMILKDRKVAVRCSKYGLDIFPITISTEDINYRISKYLENKDYREIYDYIILQDKCMKEIIEFWDEEIDEEILPVNVFLVKKLANFPAYYDHKEIFIQRKEILSHELTHYFYRSQNTSLWLLEGRAEYSQYKCISSYKDEFKLKDVELILLNNLEKEIISNDIYNYRLGLLMTKYIIDNYGLDKYKEIYYDESKFNEICGMTISDLENKIYERLKNKYENN